MTALLILPPIFHQVLTDVGLTNGQLRAWRAALHYLDFVEPRPLKLAVLAHDLGASEGSLSRAVGRLVECGYLVRAGRQPGGGPWRYRVPLSRARDR